MSNFEGRRRFHRGDGGFPKRTQCQTLRASCSFHERRAHGSRRRFLWSAWSLLPLSGMACPPRTLALQSACKPTHSHCEQAERQPFWGFAPNEPIFRFRSIRRVAVSDATTESGVSSVEILEQGCVSTRGSSPKGCQNPLAHPSSMRVRSERLRTLDGSPQRSLS